MHQALTYLGNLPPNTIVYNGHEYTSGNVAFAKSIDPDNPSITKLDLLAKENKITTGLTTIADEKEWNVFMRLGSDAVKSVSCLYIPHRACIEPPPDRQATGASSESAIMEKLRELKNNYKL
jgi:hydroxyacylglutathione hydrolase